jgi:Flp pilus assembly protein TadD
MRYKETEKPLSEIAGELNVDALVTGGAQQVGDSLSIQVQLIDVHPEVQNLWEQTYDRAMTDVFLIHSDLARAIARKVNVKLTAQEETHFASIGQVDSGAMEAYLKGEFHWGLGTEEGQEKGLAYYHQAIEIDPKFALGYAGLAFAYNSIGHSSMATPDSFPRALAAARSALRLDETLVEGHVALALIKFYHEWDWAGAEKAFLRANELNPNLAMNHYHYAWYLAVHSRFDEAIEEHILSKKLDPLNPKHTADLGLLYWYEGRYEEAIDEAQKSLELNPDYDQGLYVLGRTYAVMGMFEEAIAAGKKLVEVAPWRRPWLGIIYVRAGQREEAQKILAELVNEEPTPILAYSLASLYAALGEMDEAFHWLNYEHSHAWLPAVRIEPEFGDLRSDPRFDELLKKMNLPPVEDN